MPLAVCIKLNLSNIKQLDMKHLVLPGREEEGGGGVLRILIDGDDRRIFRGLKFSIPGLPALDLSKDFLGY